MDNARAEWLEADGLGGYASGCVDLVRRRRYHALLLTATRPPSGRMVLVSGFDAWVDTVEGRFALTSQRYAPDALSPDGADRLAAFACEPWPRWTWRLPGGVVVEQELLVPRERSACVLSWRVREGKATTLTVRPFLCGRDYHALHHENGVLRFDAAVSAERVEWHPYEPVPPVVALHDGEYHHEPHWYRRFLYEEERARGLDFEEDLASPGVLRFDLGGGRAVAVFATPEAVADVNGGVREAVATWRVAERERRARFASPLHRAAEAYVVRRGAGRTILAGYPWFTDWGRDTFIAVRGLCLATGRHEDARDILLQWAGAVSEGMLPNRFADDGDVPEYNAVDASLWFVVAVHDLLRVAGAGVVDAEARERLGAAVVAIVDGYSRGTRHGIRADADGLLAAGEPGVQLTWMDARVDGREITPRTGKPVEVQALWINALFAAVAFEPRFHEPLQRARDAFAQRFPAPDGRGLRDVVDVDHTTGQDDDTVRPNQVLAVGGLPVPLVEGAAARAVVDRVEEALLTPLGLRSLAQQDPEYVGRYQGGVNERDGVYHQGTVWPWLLGPFVEAWLRVRGNTAPARAEARRRFLDPLVAHLAEAGLGHVSEIADGDAPWVPRGAPFQAWSVGAALRIHQLCEGVSE